VVLAIIAVSCNSSLGPTEIKDVFSVYLVDLSSETISVPNPALADLVLESEPLLSIASLTGYEWKNHRILFTSDMKEQLKAKEPLLHWRFAIVANDGRIYWGMFLDALASQSCQNPVVLLLPRKPGTSSIPDAFVIDRAYPQYVGSPDDRDLRSDVRILEALESSGKLMK
jgi:hypothetical protein